MTVSLGNEETLVEIPAVEFLQNLPDGYTYIHGGELIPERGRAGVHVLRYPGTSP